MRADQLLLSEPVQSPTLIPEVLGLAGGHIGLMIGRGGSDPIPAQEIERLLNVHVRAVKPNLLREHRGGIKLPVGFDNSPRAQLQLLGMKRCVLQLDDGPVGSPLRLMASVTYMAKGP